MTTATELPAPNSNTRASLDGFRALFNFDADYYDSPAAYLARMDAKLRHMRKLGLAGSFAYSLPLHRQMVACRNNLAVHWAAVDAATLVRELEAV